jgi:hypothetical protein
MKCIDCLYFDGSGHHQINPILGECRRYPPPDSPKGQYANRNSYPTVSESTWCGEFVDKLRNPIQIGQVIKLKEEVKKLIRLIRDE